MCVQVQQVIVIGGIYRSDRSICFVVNTAPVHYVAAASDIEGQRPAIHGSTDTGLCASLG
jgi:hypothetical protein